MDKKTNSLKTTIVPLRRISLKSISQDVLPLVLIQAISVNFVGSFLVGVILQRLSCNPKTLMEYLNDEICHVATWLKAIKQAVYKRDENQGYDHWT